MKAFQIPEVGTAPELPVLSEILDPVRISATFDPAECRILRGGGSRLTSPSVGYLRGVGQAHNREQGFEWVMVKQGRQSGSLFLIPTDENNPDKVHLRWYNAGHEVEFGLGRVLKAKKIHIPPGHALVAECRPAKLQDEGAALELCLGEARLEAVTSRKQGPPPQGNAAATKME